MTHEPPHQDRTDDHGPVVGPQRARQGRPGVRVLMILIVSAVLAAIVLFALWGGTQDSLGDLETPAEERVSAESFEGDASSPPLAQDQPSTQATGESE